MFAPDTSPRGSWRTLYKPLVEKCSADLQWRVVHGTVVTNLHTRIQEQKVTAYFVTQRRNLWLGCPRLAPVFNII